MKPQTLNLFPKYFLSSKIFPKMVIFVFISYITPFFLHNALHLFFFENTREAFLKFFFLSFTHTKKNRLLEKEKIKLNSIKRHKSNIVLQFLFSCFFEYLYIRITVNLFLPIHFLFIFFFIKFNL